MKKYQEFSQPLKANTLRLSLVFWFSILVPLTSFSQNDHAKYGGTILIGMKGDFDSFNELNASDSDALQVIRNLLFMSLTILDENLQFTPQLARSWKFSHADTILTFYLRKDVFWTDGEPTTAEDVLFTYKLATNPKVAYPASSRFDLTEKVEVLDDYTVRFYFKKPYPDALFDTQIPILPKHILEKLPPEKIPESEFNHQPIGNGPFQLVDWKANRHVIFEVNPKHALRRPYIDRVVFQIIPDETILLTNLLIGELDVVPSLTPLGFKRIQAQNFLRGLRYEGRGYTCIGWNLAKPLFSRRVRQALTYAINKQEIIDTLLEGFAQPAHGPLLSFAWAYDKNLHDFPYQPDMARRLLNEAGWHDSDRDGILDKDGHSLEFTIKTNAGNQLRRDVAVMVQSQLKKLGIAVKVQTVEYNLLLNEVFERKDFDALILGWVAGFTVNPTDLCHSKAIENGYNFISYRNSRIDFLLEKGRTITQRNLARPYWYEFQKIIVEDCPYTFLFIQDQLAGINQRIHGVNMDVRGFLANITDWWIPKEQRR